ncbi:hypothetical protein GL218_08874 [Daldinia childiae]|uniref:uncharacterized protein n=1 Tax=Daldinia childiae TaxID=326645 RepID=UPI00144598F6|nr:uncharacterized protein GL218_08874 [Daldinia childiae]KAF3067049.1 hypothetical protein GL218_08874 [Daldinia childiae]
MLERAKRSIRQYPQFGGKGLLNNAQEEPDNQDDTPPGSGSDDNGDDRPNNDPIVVDDSDDGNTKDLDNEIIATKESITETLKEIMENQKLMTQHQEKQNKFEQHTISLDTY